MCATFPANPLPLELIILIISGEGYKLWSSSVCSHLQPPVISSLFGPNILLSTLFSNTSIYVPPLMSDTKFHAHAKPQEKLSAYILIFYVFI
jgi:hypothetical protein